MTTTDIPTIDPATLDGFTERCGIRIAATGDDGDVLVAVGHHDPDAMVKAFTNLMKRDLGWDLEGVRSRFDKPADMKAALDLRWAKFTPEGVGNWWCDWSAETEQPGTFPVTVLDCS